MESWGEKWKVEEEKWKVKEFNKELQQQVNILIAQKISDSPKEGENVATCNFREG